MVCETSQPHHCVPEYIQIDIKLIGALQWLKLPAWKVRDRKLEPHSGLQLSKKQKFSFPLTREYSIYDDFKLKKNVILYGLYKHISDCQDWWLTVVIVVDVMHLCPSMMSYQVE